MLNKKGFIIIIMVRVIKYDKIPIAISLYSGTTDPVHLMAPKHLNHCLLIRSPWVGSQMQKPTITILGVLLQVH